VQTGLSCVTKPHNFICSLNDLTGSIPPELGNLDSLEDLSLSSNDLTGSIPDELGNLDSLTYLTLSSNNLTGSIPPELILHHVNCYHTTI